MLERLWSVSLDSLKIKGLQEGDVLRIHLCPPKHDFYAKKQCIKPCFSLYFCIIMLYFL